MNYGIARQKLIDNGYIPLPVTPLDKKPAIRRWTDEEYKAPDGFSGYGVGICCGRGSQPIAGVDLDILDEKIATAMVEYVSEYLGETIYRIGKFPKCMLVYRYKQAGILKHTSKRYEIGRVEILGSGQMFVSYGTHPDTKQPYTWPGLLGGILETPAEELPQIDDEAIIKIIAKFESLAEEQGFAPIGQTSSGQISQDYDPDDPLDRPVKVGITVDQAKEILLDRDPDCSREEWVRIGMSLHFELDGHSDGLDLWDEWSRKGSKYKEGEPEKQWESFGSYRGRPVTGAYLLKLGKKETDFFKALNWSTTRFLKDPPTIPMVVDRFLPCGIVSLFYSAGGAGKSTLALHLAAKIALAKEIECDFLGHPVNGGKVVVLTAEDPDLILNRRFCGIIGGVANDLKMSFDEVRAVIDKHLMIISTFGHAIQLFKTKSDGTLATTEYYSSLQNSLYGIEDLKLVIVDTKTRYSPGEGLGNITATQEITHYETICKRTGATVMLLHHSNKSSRDGSQTGAQAYRDATALFDSVRAAWYLRGLREDEYSAYEITSERNNFLLLENSKNNYVERLEDRILERTGYSYKSRLAGPRPSKQERSEKKRSDCYEKVIGILQKLKKNTSQGDLVRIVKDEMGVGRKTIVEVIDELVMDNLIDKRREGPGFSIYLTEIGARYNLSID